MTADQGGHDVAVVACSTCGTEYVRGFSEDQLRELVDAHVREVGGTAALAALLGVHEKTIRRLRQLITVSQATLLKIDRFYQANREMPERLKARIAYDQRRASDPRFGIEMRGPRLVIRPRLPGS